MLFDQLSHSGLFCGFSFEDWELACIDAPILFSDTRFFMKNLARGDAPFLSSEAHVFVRIWRAATPPSFLVRLTFL
jgi:hypothetical protein